MNIDWNQELSADDNFIDEQHKELFHRINNLVNAVNIGRCKEETRNILAFLSGYMVYHLESEENYMRLNNYPDISLHILEHQKILVELNNMRSEFETNCSFPFIIGLEERITLWFVNHINKLDKSFTKFIKENK